jgi:RNA polymerase sigma-70 factor (ECF subfamily)
MVDETDEEQIAGGLRGGDPDAWRRLYDAHAERVWWLVARAVGDGSTEVGDIVQEIFLAAARSAGGFDSARGSLAAWLTGIARRQIALYFRRRKRQQPADRRVSIDPPFDEIPSRDPSGDPGAGLAAEERADQVRAALTRLPAGYEVLLITKYVDGASIDQIATADGCSAEAVRSRLARARRALRTILRRGFPELCSDEMRVHDDV